MKLKKKINKLDQKWWKKFEVLSCIKTDKKIYLHGYENDNLDNWKRRKQFWCRKLFSKMTELRSHPQISLLIDLKLAAIRV